jgi:hypothetical protein
VSFDAGIYSIKILGQQDETLHVHGDAEGTEGVWIAEDGVDTLLTASPEKQTWKTGARTKGSRPKNRKILHKDIDLRFIVADTETSSFETNQSYLEQAIGYELDPYDDDAKYARAVVTTDISGTRYLDIVQYEEPDFSPKTDPLKQQFGDVTCKVRCGDPDWYELFDGKPYWLSACDFTEDGEGFVEVWNPTPRDMYQTWICTPGKWTIPDNSWRGSKGHRYPGGPDSARFITTPLINSVQGGLRLNTRGGRDGTKLMAEDFNDTNVLALFAGQMFINLIPPYTQKQKLPVFLEDCPPSGARIELRQPRFWSRPYGQELI